MKALKILGSYFKTGAKSYCETATETAKACNPFGNQKTDPTQRKAEQAQRKTAEYQDYKKRVKAFEEGLGNNKWLRQILQGVLGIHSSENLDKMEKTIDANRGNDTASHVEKHSEYNEARKAKTITDRFAMLQSLSSLPAIGQSFAQEGFFEGLLTAGKSIAGPILSNQALDFLFKFIPDGASKVAFQLLAQQLGFSFIQQGINNIFDFLLGRAAQSLDGHNTQATFPRGGLTTQQYAPVGV